MARSVSIVVPREPGLADERKSSPPRPEFTASIGPDTSETLHGQDIAIDIEPEHPQMGQLVAAAADRAVETSLTQTRVLIGAGTAAGLAAAYNTPFAASLFVLHVLSTRAGSTFIPARDYRFFIHSDELVTGHAGASV